MKLGSVDPGKLSGLVDKVTGLGKEIMGTVLDNDRLSEAGEAQQAKGTEKLKALKQEAKAEAKEAKAEAFEKEQKAAQRAKSA